MQSKSHNTEFSEHGFFSSKHEKSKEGTEQCRTKRIIFFITFNNLVGLIINIILIHVSLAAVLLMSHSEEI